MLKVASKSTPYNKLTDEEKIKLKSEIRSFNYENYTQKGNRFHG